MSYLSIWYQVMALYHIVTKPFPDHGFFSVSPICSCLLFRDCQSHGKGFFNFTEAAPPEQNWSCHLAFPHCTLTNDIMWYWPLVSVHATRQNQSSKPEDAVYAHFHPQRSCMAPEGW